MTISELLNYLWDGVDIPVTKEEIQHSVNVATWALKEEIKDDKDMKALNDAYKISCYDEQHGLKNINN